ncbi:hypothetical protein R1sor_021396 [Riccia sorocarpa]|uniref:Uncharacterized protein n=1 Tax=Riccia sorocarpa TaxID=122646 RepID=A0ABD3GK33_9MARC
MVQLFVDGACSLIMQSSPLPWCMSKKLHSVTVARLGLARRGNGLGLQVSDVGKVSRQFFPLSAAEQEAVRGVRRKRESSCHESCSFKRRQELLRPSLSGFESPFKMVVPATGRCNSMESFMDTS